MTRCIVCCAVDRVRVVAECESERADRVKRDQIADGCPRERTVTVDGSATRRAVVVISACVASRYVVSCRIVCHRAVIVARARARARSSIPGLGLRVRIPPSSR